MSCSQNKMNTHSHMGPQGNYENKMNTQSHMGPQENYENKMNTQSHMCPQENYGVPMPSWCSMYRTPYDLKLLSHWDKVADEPLINYTKLGDCCSNKYPELRRYYK
jgi:hypothetical protein